MFFWLSSEHWFYSITFQWCRLKYDCWLLIFFQKKNFDAIKWWLLLMLMIIIIMSQLYFIKFNYFKVDLLKKKKKITCKHRLKMILSKFNYYVNDMNDFFSSPNAKMMFKWCSKCSMFFNWIHMTSNMLKWGSF